jgi:tetratricopeptide (TPR) repeat protein
MNSRIELTMAETITLRAYLNDLSAKLEQGSSTAVISHCRYILQHYPQNVEAYRLLGKALLQKGQDEGLTEHFEEAAEVFRRVLSVLPNDYVAHLGMSEIRAYEEALDAAIWHLERAYEQMPGNQVLQEALHELYVKRDGEDQAPEKIHLTRSALARQYITGQLYDQALIELRTALEQDPARVDLQVLLAETLWNSQHPIEAGEVAVQILKKLPNCLAANRILARLWLDNERPTDAQVFLDRLEAVDPYTAASVVRPGSEVPDPNLLPQLDYSAQAQAVLSSETPDWVQELTHVDTESAAERPAQARSEQAEPQHPPAWMNDAAASLASPDVPDWFAGELPQAAAEAPDTSARADWLSSALAFGEGPADEEIPAAEIPDWFVEAAGAAPESEGQPAVRADWLPDLEDVTDQGPLPSIEELMGVESAEQPSIEADWLVDEDSPIGDALRRPESQGQSVSEADWLVDAVEDEAPDGFFARLEKLGPAEIAPDVSDERLSSGFTDLLAGIEAAQISSDVSEGGGDIEPVPPDWLDVSEEEASSQAEVVPQPEAPSSERAELETPSSPEAPETPEQQEISGEDVAFWASFDEPVPGWTDDAATTKAPEAVGTFGWEVEPEEGLPIEDSQAEMPLDLSAVAAPEWLPQTKPLTGPGDAAAGDDEALPASTGDWMSDLRELDSLWLEGESGVSETPDAEEPEAQPEAERPAPSGPEEWLDEATEIGEADLSGAGAPTGEEREVTSEDQIEPASEIPEWVRDAAPIPEVSEEPGAEIPEFPGVDVDLMSLFDAQDSGAGAVESWEAIGAGDELQASEPQADVEHDWLEPAPADDDWLGAFAKFEAEETESGAHDVTLGAQIAADEAPVSAALGAEGDLLNGGEAGEPDNWLTEVPDLEIETVPGEEPSADAVSVLPSDAVESALFEEETTGDEPAVEIEADQPDRASLEEVAVSEDQHAVEEDEPPAWMAEIEPIEEPGSGQENELFQQAYDPFEGGSPDQVPQYASAGVTGILQPDEQPDWIRAFTDEELSAEPEDEEFTAQSLDLTALGGFEEGEEAGLDTGEVTPITEGLADLGFESAAEYPSDDDEAQDFESDQPAEEGDLPDWLLAITNSEADKLDDVFLEPELYSSTAKDQGVLQPGSEPDWLVEIGAQVEEAPLAEVEPAGAAESPDQADAEFVVSESFDVVFSEEESAAAVFEEAELPADLFAEEPDEVAQAADLAHTNELEPVTEAVGQPEEDTEAESVPEDFSFGELRPIWLRKPKEGDLAATIHGGQEEPPDVPEWLRDIFEDDESGE